MKHLDFSSLVLRLFGKIHGFVFCSLLPKLGFSLKKNYVFLFKTYICANINFQDQAEYNDKKRTAYFDTADPAIIKIREMP